MAFVNFGAMTVGNGENVSVLNVRYTGSRNRMASGRGAATIAPRSSLRTLRLSSSIGTRPRLGAALPGADCRPRWSGRRRRLASRALTAVASPGQSGPGRGAAPHRRASMQIWILCSTLRSTLRLVPRATAPSAAGRWSAMSGNGRPRTSLHSPALPPILMKTIQSRGSVHARCCAAGAGRRAQG